jgi:hypothetical protein
MACTSARRSRVGSTATAMADTTPSPASACMCERGPVTPVRAHGSSTMRTLFAVDGSSCHSDGDVALPASSHTPARGA